MAQSRMDIGLCEIAKLLVGVLNRISNSF